MSDESGQYEVYVAHFPDSKDKQQVSRGAGGSSPRWRKDGKEIFFVDGSGNLNAVPVIIGKSLELGDPNVLFPISLRDPGASGIPYADYDVSQDGQRFIIAAAKDNPRSINIILNWPAALGR